MGGAPAVPRVVRVDRQNFTVVHFAVRHEGYDRTRLKEFLENLVVTQLQRIDGVQAAWTFGGPRRQIQVNVDRDKLVAHGLKIQQIRKAIDDSNISRTGGHLINHQ